MTFEEDSKDVQEAEEEVPAVSAEAEEMLEGREEQVEEGGEEDVEGNPEEGGDDEASAEELQWWPTSAPSPPQVSWCFKETF